MSLVEGYLAATSTEEYVITGAAPVTVSANTNHGGKIIWNNITNKLDIATGLTSGDYPVVLTASNGVQPDAALSFTLAVRTDGVPPTISGPTLMIINEENPAISVGVYTITGTEPVAVNLADYSGGNIIWDNDARMLRVAPDLAAGEYGVILVPGNTAGTGAPLLFALRVDPKYVKPGISGPSSRSLSEGYESTSVGPYSIAGTEPVVVTIDNDYGGKIKWNEIAKTLDIAEGLPLGSNPVELTASNMTAPDAVLVVTLAVNNNAVTGVTLDRTSAALEIGDAVQLTETVIPGDASDKSVKWSVSDPSVATVSALGFVKAVGAGDAIITVTTNDGGYAASCNVHVNYSAIHSNDIIPTQPELPPGTPAGIVSADPIIVVPSDPSDISPEVDWIASVIPGIDSTDLDMNKHGIITIGDWVANEIAKKLLGVDHVEVVTIPVFEAYTNNPGETAAVSFKVKGKSLMIDGLITKPENVRLMNILSANSGDWYSYVGTANALSDKTFTILDMNNNIVTGELDPDGDYYLLFLIKDGGEFDLDGQTDGTVWGVLSLVGVPVTQITLTPDTLELMSGGSYNLSAGVGIAPRIADNQAVKWSSNNDSVASVNTSGVVTGISGGTATITAITADRGLKASCVVTVKSTIILVTEIKLNPASMTLGVENTYSIIAIVTPSNATNPAVTWSSNNIAVATVSNTGIVSTVSEGIVTITATAVDGGGASGSCTITVSKPVVVEPIYPPKKDEVSDITGIDPDDLEEKGDKVYIKDPLADIIARELLDLNKLWSGDKAVYITILPVFKGTLSPNGAIARISFRVTGKELFELYPENVNLIGMILGGKSHGMLFDYVNSESEFDDKKFTIFFNGKIFDGRINPNATYELVVFIKDGGIFDLDGLPNGEVICSLFIASEKRGHRGGGGCNAGVGLIGLALLTQFISRKRKK
jgi:uncharacterized protein YjdB